MPTTNASTSLVLVGNNNGQNGVVVIPAATPLTRLNYFDGKFLRASDLKIEQDYLRQLVRQSNQAGGPGVAYGYDVTLGGGDTLNLGRGLAIDPEGRVLLLPQETTINIQELIDKSRALQQFFASTSVKRAGSFEACQIVAGSPANTPQASDLYLITISSAEALCGEEDVFGKLCEEACATSTDRPFLVEGLIVRAIPLSLQTALPSSKIVSLTGRHLRSRVASAYFEDERKLVASLISKFGLEQETWCLGADAAGGIGVPIGVIARTGATTAFLDAWIARRERIDPPAKRYWQWRMMMRPWDVYLAQILQFQCQLHDLIRQTPTTGGGPDTCGDARDAINEAATTIAELRSFYQSATERFLNLKVNPDEAITFKGGGSRLAALNDRLINVGQTLAASPQDRLLIRGGIIELPSAGYLPVVPGAGVTINQQVRQWMGEGVDLRFCVVRPDYVAHALEEAQHMERISLLQGLDDSLNKPKVDILVPDGEIIEQQRLSPGRGFEATVDLNSALFSQSGGQTTGTVINQTIPFRGAARSEVLPSGGGAAYVSAEYEVDFGNLRTGVTVDTAGRATVGVNLGDATRFAAFDRVNLAAAQSRKARAGVWISLKCDRNIFELKHGDDATFNARAIVALLTTGTASQLLLDVELSGTIEITQATVKTGSAQTVKGRLENARFSFLGIAFGNTGPRKTLLVDLNATIRFTGGSAMEILLDHEQSEVELSANWDKQPLEVKAALKLKSLGAEGSTTRESQLAAAALKENPGVLSAGNANHIQALDALEVIAAALNDATFADAKARLLFPDPPKPLDELIVRGTKDWVLFHRRRNKQCQEEKPAPLPPPSPGRLYQVYHVLAQSRDEAETLRKLLLENKIPANRLSPVAIVEFGGGVAALVTSPANIQSDWSKVNPGNTIVYGAIGNRDSAAADGESLARLRLDRLEDTLAPISKLDPQAFDDLLNGVPSSVPAAGVDGVILLVTIRQVPNLTLTKTDAPDPVTPGANITYTLNFANTGPVAASTVTVTDTLPANTTFVSASATNGAGWALTPPATGGTGNVVFTKPSVAGGETATFQIVVRVSNDTDNATTIINTATAASTGSNTATATATTSVVRQAPSADLSITKVGLPAQVRPGDTVTYTLTVTNAGPAEASNVTVTDTLPAQTTFSQATVSTGAVTQTAEVVTWTIPKLGAGATATITIVALVGRTTPGGTILRNEAKVSSATNDPNPANNTATATSTVIAGVSTGVAIWVQLDSAEHFPPQNAPKTTVQFGGDELQGDELPKLVKSLTTSQPVAGVAVHAVKSSPDDRTTARAKAAVRAIAATTGRPESSLRMTTDKLSDKDRTRLEQAGIKPADFDDVIFLENR